MVGKVVRLDVEKIMGKAREHDLPGLVTLVLPNKKRWKDHEISSHCLFGCWSMVKNTLW